MIVGFSSAMTRFMRSDAIKSESIRWITICPMVQVLGTGLAIKSCGDSPLMASATCPAPRAYSSINVLSMGGLLWRYYSGGAAPSRQKGGTEVAGTIHHFRGAMGYQDHKSQAGERS